MLVNRPTRLPFVMSPLGPAGIGLASPGALGAPGVIGAWLKPGNPPGNCSVTPGIVPPGKVPIPWPGMIIIPLPSQHEPPPKPPLGIIIGYDGVEAGVV